jgi:hypothetical protein
MEFHGHKLNVVSERMVLQGQPIALSGTEINHAFLDLLHEDCLQLSERP